VGEGNAVAITDDSDGPVDRGKLSQQRPVVDPLDKVGRRRPVAIDGGGVRPDVLDDARRW